MIEAASVQTEQAEGVIRQVEDPSARAGLNHELSEIRAGQPSARVSRRHLRHRLRRQDVARQCAPGPRGRQERSRDGHDPARPKITPTPLDGVDGSLFLTDTPGLSEIGEAGSAREQEARDLAARADLLIFVLDHDLTRTEFEPLSALVRQGKRSIVFFNKTDRFSEPDSAAILAKLKERLRGLVPPDDIVAGAASPRPITVRVQKPDGTVETQLEDLPPELAAPAQPHRQDPRAGRRVAPRGQPAAASPLAHDERPRSSSRIERDRRAEDVVEKFQWITAGTVFANPFPALELVANGAVQLQMISELAGVYGVQLSASHVRMIGGQMVQMLLKLGLVETATSLVAGIFKSSLVGYAAAGAVQAVSMAYLTHVSGEAFSEYFRQGQTWGDGGMQAALIRQFDLTSRAEFLQEFAKQAVQKVSTRFLQATGKTPERPATQNPSRDDLHVEIAS